MDETLRERIEGLTAPPNERGCQQWLGGVTTSGVPRINQNGRYRSPRRILWTLVRGPIPPEHLVVPGVCNNQRCMTLAHAVLTTRSRDAKHRLRPPMQARALSITCSYNHPLAGANLHIRSDGARGCVTCERRQTRDWEKAHPEAVRAIQARKNAKRREQYWNDVEYREKRRAADRAARAANREEYKAKERARRAANRDAINARKRAAYAANPEAHKAASRAWRAANRDENNARARAYRATKKAATAAD
jgi:hypothetical protein